MHNAVVEYIIICSTCLVLASCSTSQMLLHEPLTSQAESMPVKGRQGWLLNQRLSFGTYQTDRVQNRWAFSFGMDVLLAELEGAQQKYSFNLEDTG